jgi:cation transport regulator
MPYKELSDLPKTVTEHLPKHGQEIYLKAFNSAFQEYKDPKKRQTSSHEETAYKVAWTAVKKIYKKSGSKWIKKEG